MTETTVAVSTHSFVGLISDVSRCMAAQPDLPFIAGVLVTSGKVGDGCRLVATATDRFTIAQANTEIGQVSSDVRFWLPATRVKQLMVILRPFTKTRRINSEPITITVDDEAKTCSISQPTLGDLASINLSFPLETGAGFPQSIAEIYVDSGDTTATGEPVQVNPKYLARIAGLCRANENLQIDYRSPSKPIRIAVGDRLWALVMPTRKDADWTPPWFDLAVPVMEEQAA